MYDGRGIGSMKANIPQRADTPLQLHEASQVNGRCQIFFVFFNSTKTPTLPIKYSGQGALKTLNFAIDRLSE